jgi:hypothetical protein
MLSEEAKARQKEAKRLWYERNKDTYRYPDSDKRKENVRKASLAYYYRNKKDINTNNKNKTKQAHVDDRISLIKRMNELVKEEREMLQSNLLEPFFYKRVIKPLACLF